MIHIPNFSIVKKIMEKAGSEMIKIFNSKNLEIETKSNNTPVTIADKISNDIIIFELEKISNILFQ